MDYCDEDFEYKIIKDKYHSARKSSLCYQNQVLKPGTKYRVTVAIFEGKFNIFKECVGADCYMCLILNKCEYATLGCAHAETCNRSDYSKCGYWRYFVFLDENF